MPESIVFKVVGPTQALSVNSTSGAGITVTTLNNEPSNYFGFINPSVVPVLVTIGILAANANPPAPVFPSTTSGPVVGYMIPPNTTFPYLVPSPNGGGQVAGITNSSTAVVVFVTPMGDV
jgi:hypothetical protein